MPWIERWMVAPPSSASARPGASSRRACRASVDGLDRPIELCRARRGVHRGVADAWPLAPRTGRSVPSARRPSILLDRAASLSVIAPTSSIDAAISLIDDDVSSAAAARSSALAETPLIDASSLRSPPPFRYRHHQRLRVSADGPDRASHLGPPTPSPVGHRGHVLRCCRGLLYRRAVSSIEVTTCEIAGGDAGAVGPVASS